MGLTPVTDEEVESATYAHGSQDMPERDIIADLKAIEEMMGRGTTGVDIVKAIAKAGYRDVAESVLSMLKQRVSGDYLHTSAILDSNYKTISAVNDVNDYAGPGTGYRLEGKRWEEIKNIPNALDPQSIC